MCLHVAGIAQRKHVADDVLTTIGKGFDVVQFKFSTTTTTSAAMLIAAQLCLPLLGGEGTSVLAKAGAAYRSVLLFVANAMRCAFPVSPDFEATFAILFRPLRRSAKHLFAMLLVPALLILLCLSFVLAIVQALRFPAFLQMFSVVSASVLAMPAAMFCAPLLREFAKFGGVFSVLSLYGHAEFYHHIKKGVQPWTQHKWMISSSASGLITRSTVSCRRMLCRMRISYKSSQTRINNLVREKFSLIDLDGEIPNKAEGASHGERLSERTSKRMMRQSGLMGMMNHERAAEMSAPAL